MEPGYLKFRAETTPPLLTRPGSEKMYLDLDHWPNEILFSDYMTVYLNATGYDNTPPSKYVQVDGDTLTLDLENGRAVYHRVGPSNMAYVTVYHLEWGTLTDADVRPADGERETSLARRGREGRDGTPTGEADDRRGTTQDGADSRPRGDG